VLSDVHNVRVRDSDGRLTVNFHCRAAPDLDVASVHRAVDAVERTLRLAQPDIARVVGHAEPLRGAPPGH
jgi:divalent metal cation (Fe/Co/Zn/Cd) transporter